MDFRIIETDTLPVLIYRDEEAEAQMMIIRVYLEGMIYSARHHYSFLSADGVRQIIQGFSEKDAQQFIDTARALLNESESQPRQPRQQRPNIVPNENSFIGYSPQ